MSTVVTLEQPKFIKPKLQRSHHGIMVNNRYVPVTCDGSCRNHEMGPTSTPSRNTCSNIRAQTPRFFPSNGRSWDTSSMRY